MNKEKIDKWLEENEGISYTRLEELHDWLCDRNIKFQDEIERLNNIINELEKNLLKDNNYFINKKNLNKNNSLALVGFTITKKYLMKIKKLKGEENENK